MTFDFAPHLAAVLTLLASRLLAANTAATGAIAVFATGVIVGAILIYVADAYARRRR